MGVGVVWRGKGSGIRVTQIQGVGAGVGGVCGRVWISWWSGRAREGEEAVSLRGGGVV